MLGASYLLRCTLLLLSYSSIGNNTIDSLLNALDKNKEDSTKVRLLFSISEQYFSLVNEVKATLFIEDAIGLAEN